MSAYQEIDHTYDVVVVGAGGARLRATLGFAEAGLRPRVSRRSSRPAAMPSLHRAGSARPSATWARTTG